MPTMAVYQLDIWLPEGTVVRLSMLEGGSISLTPERRGRFVFTDLSAKGRGVIQVRFWPTDGRFPTSEVLDLRGRGAATLTVDPEVEVELVSVVSAARRTDPRPAPFRFARLAPPLFNECCVTACGITACGCSVMFNEGPCAGSCCETPPCPLETCGSEQPPQALFGATFAFEDRFGCKNIRRVDLAVVRKFSQREASERIPALLGQQG
ncbi:MAG TPA: hypothetical protein VLH75_03795 [Longimicrobiales bacterium]|nr:hypothetical protein [Longimicrobiales bacterium]